MTIRKHRSYSFAAVVLRLAIGLSLAGCDDPVINQEVVDLATPPDAAGPSPDLADICRNVVGHDIRCDNTAFAVGVRVRTDNAGNRIVYFRALPDTPTGDQDVNALKNYVEGGNDDLFWNNGYLYRFNRDAQFWSRYSASVKNGDYSNPVLELSPKSFSIKNFGFGNQPTGAVFVSNELAISGFSFASPGGSAPTLYRWNPETMQLIGNPINANYVKPYYGNRFFAATPGPQPFGDYATVTLQWQLTDKTYGNIAYPYMALGLVKTDGSQDLTIVEDTSGRCGLGGTHSWVDAAGDLYVLSGSGRPFDMPAKGQEYRFTVDPTKGQFTPPTHPSICRIKKGTTSFDQTYYVDLLKSGLFCTIQDMKWVSGRTVLVTALAKEDCTGVDGSTNFAVINWSKYFVNADTGDAMLVKDIPKLGMQNLIPPFRAWGSLYWQGYTAQAGIDANGVFHGAATVFYKISESDLHVEKSFSTPAGDSYGLGLMTLR